MLSMTMAYTIADVRIKLSNHKKRIQQQHEQDQTRVLYLTGEINRLKEMNDRMNLHNIRDMEGELCTLRTPSSDLPLKQMCQSILPIAEKVQREQEIIFSSMFGSVLKQRRSPNDNYKCARGCNIKNVINTCVAEMYCPGCGNTSSIYENDNEHHFQTDELYRKQIYRRKPLYQRFLQQYNQTVPDIPQNIYDIILKDLFKTHVFSSTKCRPTPIIAILRKHKQVQWIPYALKISRILNNDRRDVYLPDTVIDRLLERFSEIVTLTNEDKKEKFLNYEFLTHQMLLMDNKPHHAALFKCHKTEGVYERSMSRLHILVAQLELCDTTFEWFVPTQVCNFTTTAQYDERDMTMDST